MDEHQCVLWFHTELSACLYERGFRNITNIDISKVVINQMSDTYADLEEMECKGFITITWLPGSRLF